MDGDRRKVKVVVVDDMIKGGGGWGTKRQAAMRRILSHLKWQPFIDKASIAL